MNMDEFSDGAQGAAGCFPKELIKFFEGGPRILLVKGKSRVGKTVFLLSLAETLGPPMNLFIVNTREPEPRSYETYPWLATNEARDKALENIPAADMQSKKDADVSLVSETGAKIKSARDLLKSILGEDSVAAPGTTEKKAAPQVSLVSGPAELASLRNALGNKNPRELLRVYRGLEAVGSARAFVGVNRIDRLGEKYDIPLRPLALALKADIVTARNAHLVIVLEKPATTVDDISDGIVTLKDVSHGDEFLGQLDVGKLTDVLVKQSKWMYNTLSGKFQVLRGISTL
jgi:hypothetical protein